MNFNSQNALPTCTLLSYNIGIIRGQVIRGCAGTYITTILEYLLPTS